MTVEEEIAGGIKNALEKGVPLEEIIKTFVNAGYQPQAVQAAARAVTEGATTILTPQPPANSTPSEDYLAPHEEYSHSLPASSLPSPMQPPVSPPEKGVPKEGIGKVKIFLLVGVLILLLILLGASLLFREQLIELISG